MSEEAAEAVIGELDNVRVDCRERAAGKQLDGAKAAGDALDRYLAVAAAKYSVPQAYVAPEYSKDPSEFMAQYMGVFSCEGQGLERVKGSNSCRDPRDASKNLNPFPTKKFLEFDPLTGETLKK